MPINRLTGVCKIRPRNVRDQGNIMRRITFSACITAAVVLLGCGVARPSLAAANTGMGAAADSGTASLTGSAFITAMGGEAVTCAGDDVTLVPASGRSTTTGLVEDDLKLALVGEAAGAARHVRCNAAGQFALNGLPARDWIVKTSITWAVPAKHGTLERGGVLLREIALKPGANAVVLSNNDLH